MNYKETIEYLYSQLPVFEKIGGGAYKPGLHNTIKLSKLFDHPHESYKTIHVGGTNGKGSTSHTLAAILQLAGYKVGLYTSPHLIDFRERIRVNGEKIDQDYVVSFVQNNKSQFEPINCSFFELTMMMAFCYFRDQQVDIAVIEIGLGGRLDSTNIIKPLLSIITNVSFDHTQFLGNSLIEIAKEKSGIIKSNSPIIIGQSNPLIDQIFIEQASKERTEIIFADQQSLILSEELVNGKWFYQTSKFGLIEGELGGLSQSKNTRTILAAVIELLKAGFDIGLDQIRIGFKDVVSMTGLMGRWMMIQNTPLVICDTAHNEDGMRYVSKQLENQKRDLHIIIGFANDKDVDLMLSLLPLNAIYYFVHANSKRSMKSCIIRDRATVRGLIGDSYLNITDAYYSAISNSGGDSLIFIGGSNFVVGEFLAYYYQIEML